MLRRHRLAIALVPLAGLLALVVAGVTLVPRLASAPTDSATPTEGQIDPDPPAEAVAWAFVTGLPPAGGHDAYVLQAGFLGDVAPRLDVEVPWQVGGDGDVGRQPAVAPPIDGEIVHVADDGRRSTVRTLSIADGGLDGEALATLDEAVWDLAVAPDGSAAYLALVARADGEQDQGVVRLALDGSGRTDPLLPPAIAGEVGDVRRAAVLAFNVNLEVSSDGRYLARTACLGVQGCQTEVVDLSSGERFELGDSAIHDLGPGGLVIREWCAVNCRTELLSVPTGASSALRVSAFDAGFVVAEAGAMVVTIENNGIAATLTVTDPASGVREAVYRAPDRGSLVLSDRDGLLWSVPKGTILVSEVTEREGPPAGAVVELDTRYLLFSLRGGEPTAFPAPPIRPLFPGDVQG